ncbi:MAG: Ig-like domain-containing protein [Bacteroidales bacterium]
MKKLFLILPAVALALASCGEDDVAVEGLTLSQTKVSVYLMSDKNLPELTATITPDNASDNAVTWTSDSPDVISVDAAGKLTLVKDDIETTVVITAQSASDALIKATCQIQIINNFKELAEGGYGFIDLTTELGMYMMDRNVGATEAYNSETKKSESIGNYYQWGNNTPVAKGGDASVGSAYAKEWNGSGSSFKDWSVSANTPCPSGWSIPNKAQMGSVANKAWADYDFGTQTDEEFQAAKAMYKKLLIARGGYWRIVGADAAARAAATPTLYLPTAGFWWSCEKNADVPASTRGFNYVYTLSDNYDIMLGKKAGENEVNNAMPVRCIKVVK